MKKHIITEQELKERAKFFSKHLLGIEFNKNIYYVDGLDEYGNNIAFLGAFFGDDMSYSGEYEDDYEDDYVDDYEDDYGEIEESSDCHIEINEVLKNDVLLLNNVLIHELIHYKLWYLGYDYKDEDAQFREELSKYHISSNEDIIYNNELNQYRHVIDKQYMQKYEDMFNNRKR